MSKLYKSVEIGLEKSVSDDEMTKINNFTLEPLEAKDVFVFKLMAGDNAKDDRNYEPFTAEALSEMAEMYKGKPMIWEHGYGIKGTEQIARVFDAETKETGHVFDDGTKEIQLILKAYMLNSESNQNLIREIKAGIKKEVSTSCRPKNLKCSICGVDQMKEYCRHWPGKEYEGKTCLMSIDHVKDVFEISFVGTPAQPRAGAVKSYNENLKEVREADFKETEKETEVPDHEFKLKEMELFLLNEELKGENHE